jgi:hypothetical protein
MNQAGISPEEAENLTEQMSQMVQEMDELNGSELFTNLFNEKSPLNKEMNEKEQKNIPNETAAGSPEPSGSGRGDALRD